MNLDIIQQSEMEFASHCEWENEQKTESDGSPVNHLWLVLSGRQWWRFLACQEVLHVVMHFSVLKTERGGRHELCPQV